MFLYGTAGSEDPGYLKTPFIDHSVYTMVGLLHEIDGWYHEFPMPLTWALNVTVQYGTPLEMTFTGLDPEASYGMKVFYPNSFFRAFVGQTALKDETLVNIRAGKVLLADRIAQNPNGKSVRREIEAGREPFWEYDLPKESYQDGTLKVRWEVYDTLKALAVSEVWIMKRINNRMHAKRAFYCLNCKKTGHKRTGFLSYRVQKRAAFCLASRRRLYSALSRGTIMPQLSHRMPRCFSRLTMGIKKSVT